MHFCLILTLVLLGLPLLIFIAAGKSMEGDLQTLQLLNQQLHYENNQLRARIAQLEAQIRSKR